MGIVIGMLRVAQALLLIATLTATAQARARIGRPELDQLWQDFKERYGKQYLNEIEGVRRLIWEDNYDFMQEHNTAFRSGELTFEVGENEFNDLTTDEFVSMLNGYKMSEEPRTNPIFVPKREFAPTKVDWRAKGFVTPVKNQGHCGSCWAFSATGSLEGQHFNKTKKLVSLSEQNLVDCATKEGNHGCLGGIMDKAFMYVKDNKGIDTEASYPYTAKNGACKFNATNVGANLTSWTDIKSGSEMDLALAVSRLDQSASPSMQDTRASRCTRRECTRRRSAAQPILTMGFLLSAMFGRWKQMARDLATGSSRTAGEHLGE